MEKVISATSVASPETRDGIEAGYKALAAAIVTRAIEDACMKDKLSDEGKHRAEALRWLKSGNAAYYAGSDAINNIFPRIEEDPDGFAKHVKACKVKQ